VNPKRLTAVLLTVAVSGCTTGAPVRAPAPQTECAYTVRRDVLPTWARAGFSDPSPSGIPYVTGTKGNILGIIFGYPLTAPPPTTGRNNKILWTARPAAGSGPDSAPGDLRIQARLDGSGQVVTREVPGGPGPSIVDMPRPGCWHLTLTWSNHTDTLDLRYTAAGT
jgi:hypothetical protein